MQKLTKATLLSLMIAATPLWAQDTATEETTTVPPATEAPATEPPATEATAAEATDEAQSPAPDNGLSMGTPVGEEGAAPADGNGQAYVKATHGDWELRCVRPEAEQPEQCQLYQLLNDQAGNSVAELTLLALPAGGQAVAGANIVTPLETLLTEQLTLSVDGGKGRRYPYTFCTQIGCVARIGFTEAEVNAFKAGSAATLVLVPARAPTEKVNLKVSLSGFTAGYNALVAAAAAAN